MKQILLKDVNYVFRKNHILKNINLVIENGDYIEIKGPNGGGKTTLIKIVLGILKPTSGTIEYLQPIKYGYVPQFSKFEKTFPINTLDTILMGSLKYPILYFNKYSKETKRQAESIIDLLKISHIKSQPIAYLSGGQLQKVLFARALMAEPNLLILDEPTANMDEEARKTIHSLLDDLHKKITILKVTHGSENSESVNKTIYINSTLKANTDKKI